MREVKSLASGATFAGSRAPQVRVPPRLSGNARAKVLSNASGPLAKLATLQRGEPGANASSSACSMRTYGLEPTGHQ